MNNQDNLMREMLKKGDAMLPKYANFNYEELDSS
jgi:hypothetical protein